ncbi:MAG: pyridoxal phosphate enzyme (YggS family) [Saprospiraceae bacterium]|jgi:pyridoxal phosphate enzyme (YggS family)|tara:strand:+ start:1462 stop:2121 length:660 start_codon:yes stop_codon:yes gene_type:complete
MNTFESLVNYCKEHNTTLVAVSKTKPISAIENLYNQGQRFFGENRVQELVDKEATLPKDIAWHMIGHLQTNKVKNIASFVELIHSGDRTSLLKEINKEAGKCQRKINVLLQIKIAQEESKHGWEFDQLLEYLSTSLDDNFENINFRGVMGMATFTDNETVVSQEFINLKSYFDQLQSQYFSNIPTFDTISMGMSGDYELAVDAGSNMVRVGSLLFGKRN